MVQTFPMRVFVQSSPPSPKASTLLKTGLVSLNDKSWSNTVISNCSELEALYLWKASKGRRPGGIQIRRLNHLN